MLGNKPRTAVVFAFGFLGSGNMELIMSISSLCVVFCLRFWERVRAGKWNVDPWAGAEEP